MRPALTRTAVAAACLAAMLLAGCGKHVASNAPITFAPADTPYLIANFKGVPADVKGAWSGAGNTALSMQMENLGRLAAGLGDKNPEMAKVLEAVRAELADVHSIQQLEQTIGYSPSALSAIYGIGDVPVVRVELASPENFKNFWSRVEKRAGITTPTATLDGLTYRVIGGGSARLHLLVAVQDKQLVATIAPANASEPMLKQLLGLTKPADNASDRLARINSEHSYNDFGSGYVDLPKLFANLYDGKNAVTQEFAKDLGGSLTDPACASEFGSLANQVPLASMGLRTYTAKEIRYSVDMQLAPALLGALSALKQPVAGMGATSDGSMFDMVMALPLRKWQTFIEDRARAASGKTYQCAALQSLNGFAKTAANPPVQLPPEAGSLLGYRLVLDKWEAGPQIAGRVLVASSDPAALARQIQQTLPQFLLKTIQTDGKPVAFDLPPKLQAMLGGGNQGWIAADGKSLVAGIGSGEDAKLGEALQAPAGNGDTMLRMHFDGKLYGILGNWIGRFAALAPQQNQAQGQQMVALFQQMEKVVAAVDMDAKLDDKGLHIESGIRHR